MPSATPTASPAPLLRFYFPLLLFLLLLLAALPLRLLPLAPAAQQAKLMMKQEYEADTTRFVVAAFPAALFSHKRI